MKRTLISMHIQQINIKIMPATVGCGQLDVEREILYLIYFEEARETQWEKQISCKPIQIQTFKNFLQRKILAVTEYDNLHHII